MTFGGIDVSKARGLPGGVATRDGAALLQQLEASLRREQDARLNAYRPMPRPFEWSDNEFGPGWPLNGQPLDAPRPDSGQPDPRLTQYPVSWNLQLGADRHVSWETLKRAADSPLFRACIEYRKNELSTMDWQIRVSPKVASLVAQKTGKNKDQVAAELRDKYQGEIDRLTDFWTVPDRKNGRDFGEWISLAADEQLTHDALAIYPHMTYGGELLGLWVIDGTTIKPLMDETGGRPLPPYPAYQQLLYGFPRGEFTAQVLEQEDGTEITPGAILSSQLIYRRRTPRTYTPYGFSPTEQALLDGLLWNKRFTWMVSEYTEGVMPAQFMESDGMLDWTPTQLLDYERQFNDRMAGQTAERMRAQFLPPGFRAAAMSQVGERYKAEYDLFLVKLVSMHFNVMATELGFNDSGGLGSSGYHDGQEDIQFRKARMPDLRWFSNLCTQISQTHLKMPADLEFAFLGLDEEDEAAADELDHNRTADGRMVLNESRARLGLAPYGFKEANMPMLQTARGVVFLEGASEVAPPGVLIEPASEANDVGPDGTTPQGKPGQQAAKKPIKGVSNAAKSVTDEAMSEYVTFIRWQAKHPDPSRPFRFEHMTPDMAKAMGDPDLLRPEQAVLKASDADPKAAGQAGSAKTSWSPYTGLS